MKWSSILCKALSLLVLSSSFTFFSNSYASTQATVTYRKGSSYYSSPSAACSADASYKYYTKIGTQTTASGPTLLDARYVYGWVGAEIGACGLSAGQTNGPGVNQYETCPYPGATQIINGRMVCGTGPLENSCPAAGTKSSVGFSASVAGSGSSVGCADSGGYSCAATCNSSIATYDSNTGMNNIYCSSVTYSGASCNASDPKATSVSAIPSSNTVTPLVNPPKSLADCPQGSGFAQVNNTGMCLANGSSYSGASSTATSSTGSTITSDSTKINGDGTNTTTRTITTKDAAGNITGQQSFIVSGSVNQADGTGTNAGNTLPPNFGTAPTFDETLPGEAVFTKKTQSNPTFSTTIFTSSASCPAPLTYEAMGRSFSISFQAICDLADIIRGIVLMLSGIVALRAVVTS